MDINGTLLWNDLNIFQYKVHFFKLDVDSHYFEPNLNQSITNEDWNLNEERSLLPEQTGCLVYSIGLDNFREKFFLHCQTIVTYSVTNESKLHKLQLFGGAVTIDRQFLMDFGQKDVLNSAFLVKNNFLYKELLSIVVSSVVTEWTLTLKGSESVTETLQELFINNLNFNYLQLTLKEPVRSHNMDFGEDSFKDNYFYCNTGSLKYTLIRMISYSTSIKILKIYSRTKLQPLIIKDFICKDFNISCDFSPGHNTSGIAHEALRSVLDEIAICQKIQRKPSKICNLLSKNFVQESHTNTLVSKIIGD